MTVKDRFLRYIQVETTSVESCESCPSSPNQWTLARMLVDEMKALGIADARVDEHCYVYGTIPAKGDHPARVGLIAHMDTSPAVSGADIHPEIVTYQGGDLPLKKAGSLKVKDFPFLERYIGQELIVTDGTTLLGADDKAGVAEIVTACEYLLAHP